METTLNLPDGLLQEASRFAEAKGLSLHEVISSGLRLLLKAEPMAAAPVASLRRTNFPLIASKEPNHVITNEMIAQAEEDYFDAEAREYAKFFRR